MGDRDRSKEEVTLVLVSVAMTLAKLWPMSPGMAEMGCRFPVWKAVAMIWP
jgi:hypothetical protein